MINFIYIIAALVADLFLLSFTSGLKEEVYVVSLAISLIVFLIWGGCILNCIKDIINFQLKDYHDIERLKQKKESFQAEMEAYKKEMKAELLQKYKEFEKALMKDIKDSKIIATILEQSGYASVLKNYDKTISKYLNSIHECDRSLENKAKDMRVRQSDPIYTYSKFIPKEIRYR